MLSSLGQSLDTCFHTFNLQPTLCKLPPFQLVVYYLPLLIYCCWLLKENVLVQESQNLYSNGTGPSVISSLSLFQRQLPKYCYYHPLFLPDTSKTYCPLFHSILKNKQIIHAYLFFAIPKGHYIFSILLPIYFILPCAIKYSFKALKTFSSSSLLVDI